MKKEYFSDTHPSSFILHPSSFPTRLGCEDSNLDQQIQSLRPGQLDDIPPGASDRARTGDDLFHSQALSHLSYTRHHLMLPPRFELRSRADPALAGYKPAALPVELQEQ